MSIEVFNDHPAESKSSLGTTMAFCASYVRWMYMPWEQRSCSAMSFFGFPPCFFLLLLSSPFRCAVFVFPKYFVLNLIAFLVFPFILPSFPVPFSPSYFSLLSFCPFSSFKPFFTLLSSALL